MNCKSKALLAVMAVALMLGCALVPLTVDNDVAEGTDADESGTGIDEIAGLLKELKDGLSDIRELSLGGVTLMPVEGNGAEPTPIGKDVSGHVTIKSGSTVTFGNETYVFKHDDAKDYGRIIIEEGATLVLFPIGEKQKFTFDDQNNPAKYDNILIMQNGSFLNIFGMTFKVIVNDRLNLVTMDINGKSGTCYFYYNHDASNNKMDMSIGPSYIGTSVVIADMFKFTDTILLEYPFVFDGTLETVGTNGISMKGSVFFITTVLVGEEKTLGAITGIFSVEEFVLAYDIGDSGANGYISVKLSIDNDKEQSIELARTAGYKFRLLKGVFNTGKMSFGMTESKSGGKDTVNISITTEGNSEYRIVDSRVSYTSDDNKPIRDRITFKNLAFEMKDRSLSATVTDGTLTAMHLTLSPVISAEDIKYTEGPAESENTKDPTETLFEVFEMYIGIYSVTYDYSGGVSKLTVPEISANLFLYGKAFNHYTFAVTAGIYDLTVTEENGMRKVTLDANAGLLTKCNGKERYSYFALDKFSYTATEDNYRFSADSFILEKDIPNAVFPDLKNIVPEYAKMQFGDISCSKGERMHIGSASFLCRNIGVIEELNVDLNGGTDVEFFELELGRFTLYIPQYVSCGDVSGYVKNIGGEKEKFAITDNPELELIIGGFKIVKGDAKFNGGILPIEMGVGHDAKFSAKGLMLSAAVFENGCQRSGTVTLDASPGSYIRCVDGTTGACDYQLWINVYDEGYTIEVDISSLTEGTIEAKKGFVIPSSYSGEGFSLKSDDGKSGDMTFAYGKNSVSIPMMRESFAVSYEDDFVGSKTYAYGDTVAITDMVPTKEGYEFLGWSDGTGTIYYPGYEYTMPARDVEFRPVFVRSVEPTYVQEGDYWVMVINESENNMVKIPVDTMEWDVLRITTGTTTIEIDKQTYDRMDLGNVFYVGSLTIDAFDNEYVEKSVSGKQVYGIGLFYDKDGKAVPVDEEDYTGETYFKVTLNVKVNGNIEGFKVSYVNPDNGYLEEAEVESYERCEDGSYNVTFTVNHFSMYAVEPLYKSTVNNLFTLAIIIIAITVLCIAVAGYFTKRKLSE